MKYSRIRRSAISVDGSLTRISAVVKLTLMALVLCGASPVVPAQDPASTPAPTAEELRLQEENRLLELKKTNAELKKDIRESQPKASATPLEGKTTADENVVIETQMVTFKAMSDIADRIGSEIHQKFGGVKSIVIYDAEELQNLRHYRSTSPILEGRIQGLKDQYGRVLESLGALKSAASWNAQAKVAGQGGPDGIIIDFGVNKAVSAMASPGSAAANFPLPIPAVTEGLKVFADLLALIRTDTDIKGKTVSVEESAMVAETFRALRNRFGAAISLYYPRFVSPEIYLEGCQEKNTRVFCSATLSSLARLYAEKEKADEELHRDMFDVTTQFEKATREKNQAEGSITSLAKQIADLKLSRLKAELEKPWTAAQNTRFQKYVEELDKMKADAESARIIAEAALEHYAKRKNVLEQLQGFNQQADSLVANLVKADEKTGRSELSNLMRAENMDKALGADGYWLAFKSIIAGGNNRTRTNLFRYFSGAKLDHSGGLVVEWSLYNRNGKSVDSNKDSSYGGYMTPKELQSGTFKDAVADPASQKRAQDPSLASSKNP
jgi:hypothetical protein